MNLIIIQYMFAFIFGCLLASIDNLAGWQVASLIVCFSAYGYGWFKVGLSKRR